MARTNIVKQRRVGEAAAAANGPKHELMGIATRLSAAAPPPQGRRALPHHRPPGAVAEHPVGPRNR